MKTKDNGESEEKKRASKSISGHGHPGLVVTHLISFVGAQQFTDQPNFVNIKTIFPSPNQ